MTGPVMSWASSSLPTETSSTRSATTAALAGETPQLTGHVASSVVCQGPEVLRHTGGEGRLQAPRQAGSQGGKCLPRVSRSDLSCQVGRKGGREIIFLSDCQTCRINDQVVQFGEAMEVSEGDTIVLGRQTFSWHK